jgi:hypothetical protein
MPSSSLQIWLATPTPQLLVDAIVSAAANLTMPDDTHHRQQRKNK